MLSDYLLEFHSQASVYMCWGCRKKGSLYVLCSFLLLQPQEDIRLEQLWCSMSNWCSWNLHFGYYLSDIKCKVGSVLLALRWGQHTQSMIHHSLEFVLKFPLLLTAPNQDTYAKLLLFQRSVVRLYYLQSVAFLQHQDLFACRNTMFNWKSMIRLRFLNIKVGSNNWKNLL